MTSTPAPKMKREVAVTAIHPTLRVIYFYGSVDAKAVFETYGRVEKQTEKDYYKITVDARYDFDEVSKYMSLYGQ